MSSVPLRRSVILGGVGICLLAAGAVLGWMAHRHGDLEYRSIREQASEYRFINPLLFVEIGEDRSFPKYSSLKASISAYMDEVKQQGKVREMAVYFRNLNTSQWVGINPDQRFDPASMLKVATMIAVLREAESDPTFLGKTAEAQVPEKFSWKHQTSYGPEHPIENGRAYSVSAFLSHLIVESDNSANYMLNRILDQESIHKVYDHLHLPRLADAPNGYSPREYSVLYRALYNGTYLSRHYSEEALELLSNSGFRSGLVAGVPEGTLVAHKFGVRDAAENSLEGPIHRELHDCGIIYYPGEPYFLCVMTRGDDLSELESVISGVSSIAWDEVHTIESRFKF